jgi:hypothetical protein
MYRLLKYKKVWLFPNLYIYWLHGACKDKQKVISNVRDYHFVFVKKEEISGVFTALLRLIHFFWDVMCYWVYSSLLDVSEHHTTFIFTVKQSKKMLDPEACTMTWNVGYCSSSDTASHPTDVLQQQYVCCEAEHKLSDYYSDKNYTLKVKRNWCTLNINHPHNWLLSCSVWYRVQRVS